MHVKKNHFTKNLVIVIKRIFRKRNLIIISDHKVDHVPLSGMMQVLILVGVLGFFSGVSYITGSYVTARVSLREKDQRIASTTIEKTNISAEMNMLRRDLVKLGQNGKELNAYNKYIVEQAAAPVAGSAPLANNMFGQSSDKLLERISYLENHLQEIKDENDHLVGAIRERTDKKIAYFQDIIAMTGMDSDKLERMALDAQSKQHDGDMSNAVPTSPEPDNTARKDTRGHDNQGGPFIEALPVSDDTAGKTDAAPAETGKVQPADLVPAAGAPQIHGDASPVTPAHLPSAFHGQPAPQGGPFIPYDAAIDDSKLSDVDQELVDNVDRLVLLHGIVEKLPLRMPIRGAQMTGPFGKRTDPFNGRLAIHPGVDLAGPLNSPIYSTNAGKVISAGHKIAYGNAVDISHGFGIVTRYAHMSKLLVHEGQMVRKGQQIGVQGSTGRSTGAHLHYEVRINDRPVNPVKFLNAGEYVLEN